MVLENMFSIWKPTIMKTYTEEGNLIRHYEGDELPTPPYITSISLDTGNRSMILKDPSDGLIIIQSYLAKMIYCKSAFFFSDDALLGDFSAGIDPETLSTFLHEHWSSINGIWLQSCKDNDGVYTNYRIYNHYSSIHPLYRFVITRENYATAAALYKEALTRFELLNRSLLENTMVNDIGKLAVYLKTHLKLLDITGRSIFSKEDINKLTRLYQQTKALVRRPFMMDKKPSGGYSDPITFIRMFHEQYGYPVICPYTCGVKFVK